MCLTKDCLHQKQIKTLFKFLNHWTTINGTYSNIILSIKHKIQLVFITAVQFIINILFSLMLNLHKIRMTILLNYKF